MITVRRKLSGEKHEITLWCHLQKENLLFIKLFFGGRNLSLLVSYFIYKPKRYLTLIQFNWGCSQQFLRSVNEVLLMRSFECGRICICYPVNTLLLESKSLFNQSRSKTNEEFPKFSAHNPKNYSTRDQQPPAVGKHKYTNQKQTKQQRHRILKDSASYKPLLPTASMNPGVFESVRFGITIIGCNTTR